MFAGIYFGQIYFAGAASPVPGPVTPRLLLPALVYRFKPGWFFREPQE